MRYALEIAYHGKAYHGWQKQENAHSVQETLEHKLGILLQHEVNTIGCGRTDTGVHAKQFFLHFDTENKLPDNFIFRLNTMLPHDISVFSCTQKNDGFHARFDATCREYNYYIHFQKDPFLEDRSWFRYGSLDFDLMNKAAELLIGKKDFRCFCKGEAPGDNYECDIQFAQWKYQENQAVFTIKANRFLRNMVRAIVGTLIEVGMHKTEIASFATILQTGTRSDAGQSVPAHGLFLERITYP